MDLKRALPLVCARCGFVMLSHRLPLAVNRFFSEVIPFWTHFMSLTQVYNMLYALFYRSIFSLVILPQSQRTLRLL